jgi:hypothetical protein
MAISLVFAPDLVKASIDGRLPHGMGVARLTDFFALVAAIGIVVLYAAYRAGA